MPVPSFQNIGENITKEQLVDFIYGHIRRLNDFLANLDTLNIQELNAEVVIAGSITGDKIAARTITANEIAAETITANEIAADSITADRLDVNQLSAIAADLGTITAGLLQAVSIIGSTITGSLIQTSESSYPRVELRSDDELFKAAATVDRAIQMVSAVLGYPVLQLESDGDLSAISFQPSVYTALLVLRIFSQKGIQIEGGGNIDFITGIHNTTFISWNQVFNRATSRTLQQDLDSKASAFSGFTGSFGTGTQTVAVANGIITNVT